MAIPELEQEQDGRERVRIRKATPAHVSAIEVLIATSARVLGRGDYTALSLTLLYVLK